MDGRAYYKLSDGKLIGVSNRTDRKLAAVYTRHCHRGLKVQEAIIRIAADLAARIYAVLKQEKKYECR